MSCLGMGFTVHFLAQYNFPDAAGNVRPILYLFLFGKRHILYKFKHPGTLPVAAGPLVSLFGSGRRTFSSTNSGVGVDRSIVCLVVIIIKENGQRKCSLRFHPSKSARVEHSCHILRFRIHRKTHDFIVIGTVIL